MTRNKNYYYGKSLIFAGLAALILSFGLVLACCDTGTGTSPSDQEARVAEINSLLTEHATVDTRSITVRFDVQNGGWGLWKTWGIVSSQDDTILATDCRDYANDYSITLKVPTSDEYVNIRWSGSTYLTTTPEKDTFVKGKMSLRSSKSVYFVGIDYNGAGDVETTHLYDVTVEKDWAGNNADWNAALDKAAGSSIVG